MATSRCPVLYAAERRAFVGQRLLPVMAYSQGRVTLLGDAAHPMTPNLGQGAYQAVEDAVVLAASLRVGSSIQQALQTYQTARLPSATLIVTRSQQLFRH